MSQANREGITPKPTHKSATASETINALVLVRRFSLPQTRKIVIPFPAMAKKRKNPAKNPKPGLHPQKQLREVLILQMERKISSSQKHQGVLSYSRCTLLV